MLPDPQTMLELDAERRAAAERTAARQRAAGRTRLARPRSRVARELRRLAAALEGGSSMAGSRS